MVAPLDRKRLAHLRRDGRAEVSAKLHTWAWQVVGERAPQAVKVASTSMENGRPLYLGATPSTARRFSLAAAAAMAAAAASLIAAALVLLA